jgi:DNA repair protein RadC
MVAPSRFTGRRALSSPVNGYKTSGTHYRKMMRKYGIKRSDRLSRRQVLEQRLLGPAEGGLTESELLELLLSHVMPRKGAASLATDLLSRFGTVKGVVDAPTVELGQNADAARGSCVLIRLVREIAGLCTDRQLPTTEIIGNSRELERYLLGRMAGMKEEAVLLFFLDRQGVLLGEDVLGAGTIDQVVVFPRQVMERALRYNASSLIVVHNHPHGPPLPSLRDREEAERLREILRPFDLSVRDAVVVGQNRCFSIFNNAPL